jgi:hypothetical protein
MKRYLGIIIAVVLIVSLGSASAVLVQLGEMKLASPLIASPLGGGCGGHGGGGGGGCHNNSNLTELTGVLAYNGTTFTIGTTVLHFGCYTYLNTTVSPYDFDGDGELETILNELLGMVGTTITVEGYLRCQNTRLVVFYINGIEYRDCMTIDSLN